MSMKSTFLWKFLWKKSAGFSIRPVFRWGQPPNALDIQSTTTIMRVIAPLKIPFLFFFLLCPFLLLISGSNRRKSALDRTPTSEGASEARIGLVRHDNSSKKNIVHLSLETICPTLTHPFPSRPSATRQKTTAPAWPAVEQRETAGPTGRESKVEIVFWSHLVPVLLVDSGSIICSLRHIWWMVC